jgi:predicted membrane protein
MEPTKRFLCKTYRMKKFIFGLLVISAGALLIAFNQGYIPDEYRHIFFSWQMFLIAIGVINLGSSDSWIPGIVLIGVGGFFLLPELSPVYHDFAVTFWPVLLIVLGILIIFKKRRFRDHHRWHRRWEHHSNQDDFKFENGFIDESNVFSGNKRIISPGEFKGGRISNLFGGSEIDLTQTTLAEGDNYLEIDCVFGGISLIVPGDWDIHIRVKTTMGGFVDKRRNVRTTDTTRKLIIRGKTTFGGGEIKN